MTQDYVLDPAPDTYDTDGVRTTKLIYHGIGEIDFICCGGVAETPTVVANVRGVDVQLETPAEILAKKVFYRGRNLQPRDMFDIAAVSHAKGDIYVVQALLQCGRRACEVALSATERFDSDAARSIIASLMYRETTASIISTAHVRTIELLRRALD